MTRAGRAFTLIEVLVCLSIMTILIVPVLDMSTGVGKAYQTSIERVNLQSELDRIGFRVQRALRASKGYTIDADNRGARWEGGSLLWSGHQLVLTERGRPTLLSDQVESFALFRRDQVTHFRIELQRPQDKVSQWKTFWVEEDAYAAARL